MAVVWITGPPPAFADLAALPEFGPDHRDVDFLEDGTVRISAHISESMIPQIEALGFTVDIELTDAEWETHMATFRENGPPIA